MIYSDINPYASRDSGRSVPRPCAFQMATAKQQTAARRYGKKYTGSKCRQNNMSAEQTVGVVYD